MSINCILSNDVILDKLKTSLLPKLEVETITCPLTETNGYFPYGSGFTFSTVLNPHISTTFTRTDPALPNITALVAIVPADIITINFNLPINFSLDTILVVPCSLFNSTGGSAIMTIYGAGAPLSIVGCGIVMTGLTYNIGDIVYINMPPFTLFKGQ